MTCRSTPLSKAGLSGARKADTMIHSIRGFHDILPGRSGSQTYTRMESLARDIFRLYSYREIRIPTVELHELFVKSTGETSDIVEKEMYAFTDAGGREIALRPEGTPGIVRAYLENSLHQAGGVAKLFHIGNMFRAERPQAGRFREFEQVSAECLGNPHPAADAESISMLKHFLDNAGVKDYVVEINSLGCSKCRAQYREKISNYLKGHSAGLCENCRKRIGKNPLRALDCKADGPRLAAQAPRQELCRECSVHFDTVRKLLAVSGLSFEVNPNLVRGLDYYTRTVFEVKSQKIRSSQDALAAGGRYDSLVKSMGGPDVPAVGWALGVDRIIQGMPENGAAHEQISAFVISAGSRPSLESSGSRSQSAIQKYQEAAVPPKVGPSPAPPSTAIPVGEHTMLPPKAEGSECDALAFGVLNDLRSAGIPADGAVFGQSLKSQMRMAGKSGAAYAVIIGEEELKSSTCTLKDLRTGVQETVPLNKITEKVRK